MNNCYYTIYYKGVKQLTLKDKQKFQTKYSEYVNRKFDNRWYNRSIKNKNFNINGYNFRCYQKYEDIKNEIEFDRPYKFENTENKRKNKTKYSNIIYAFDIETSTYKIDDRFLSLVYLAGAKGIECKPNEITKNNINDYATKYIVMRDYNDINNWLIKLNHLSKNNRVTTLIFIHNFAYEFSFFQNLSFIKDNFSNENLMALNTRQPFKLTCDHIEFRCSYKFTGLSLQALGKNLGMEKLVDTKDYNVLYTPLSKLPIEEYIYNERDLDITLLAVLNQLKNSSAFNDTNDIRSLLTVTGLTRAENKIISPKSTQRAYSIFCKSQTELYDETLQNKRKFYQFLQDGFLGGYVRANRYFLFKTLHNVGSIDIASSYPTQMLNRYYPYDFKICKDNITETLLDLMNENQDYINKYTKKNLYNWFFRTREFPFKNYFIADLELLNVKVKQFPNNNEVPLISYHKTYNNKTEDKRLFVDNGRILQASFIRLTVTNVDLFLISLFYDFEIRKCNSLIYTNKAQRINSYVRNSINFYAEQKVIFKDLYKQADKNNIFPNKEQFYSEKFERFIIAENQIDEFITMNSKEKLHFLAEQLALSKSRLNAQYGINVQHIIPEEINYNIDTNEWYKEETEYRTPKTLLRNYSDGVFIVAYARLHLMIMTYLLINETNTTIVYWDTDSIKFFNDLENVLDKVKYFNENLEKKWFVSKKYNLGIFDFEGIYDNFSTGGSKSYISSTKNKIHLTISGVPQRTEWWYQKQFQRCHYNFAKLCYKYFHPNTIISSSVSNKLAMGYYLDNENYFDCEVKDEQNNTYYFKGYSGCILCSSDFTIYGIKSFVDIIIFSRMCKVTNNKPPFRIQYVGIPTQTDIKLKTDFAMVKDVIR